MNVVAGERCIRVRDTRRGPRGQAVALVARGRRARRAVPRARRRRAHAAARAHASRRRLGVRGYFNSPKQLVVGLLLPSSFE